MRKNGMVDKNETVKEKITMDNKEKALLCHKEWNGKLETVAKSKVKTREDLAIAYTPGVAEPCKVIAEDKTAAYTYTWKANTVPLFPTEVLSRSWKYRSLCRYAGHGRKMCIIQRIWKC